jgi:4-diphosphocytidyl-2-C-methyl-D-erythritol kinase
MTENAEGSRELWPAPGKLNLMLRVIGRRPDGYHLLQTVFQFIDRCDWLSFDVRSDGRVGLRSLLPGVPQEQDLTVRAACLLQKAAGCHYGVDIHVEKRLPMGGGLGGGSSDAATTLVALNKLWDVGFSVERLSGLGIQLGADVPVFVHGCSAWAEGIGEQLTPLELPTPWYVVIVPACHVSTAKIFSSAGLTRDSKPITIRSFISGNQDNDCLAVVTQTYQPVNAALSDLAQFGKSRLTGTGACVFAAFDSLSRAQDAANKLSDRWRVFVTKGINRSPLYDKSARCRCLKHRVNWGVAKW